MNTARENRRLHQISLRVIFLLLSLFGMLLFYVRHYVFRTRHINFTQTVVREIEAWNGSVKMGVPSAGTSLQRFGTWCESKAFGYDFIAVPLAVDLDLYATRNQPTLNDSRRAGAVDVTTHVGQLSTLKYLRIRDIPLDETDVSQLFSLKDLEVLYLDNNRLRGDWLAGLGQLSNLRRLSVRQNSVADEDLVHFKDLKNLEELYLDGTMLQGGYEDGFEHLASLTKLKVLSISDIPRVDNDTPSVVQLRKELPNCRLRITYNPMSREELPFPGG